MKIKYLVAFLFLFLFSFDGTTAFAEEPTLANAVATNKINFSFFRNLEKGARGIDVIKLQQMLSTDQSLYNGPITGFFGQLTSEAIKKLQERFGLPKTGEVGPLTKSEINDILENGLDDKGDIEKELLKQPFRAIPVKILSVNDKLGIGQAIIKPISASTTKVTVAYHERGSVPRLNRATSSATGAMNETTALEYPAHIHFGNCSSTGVVKYALNNVSQKPKETIIDVGVKELLSMGDLVVNLHDTAGKTIACGNINASKPMFKKFDLNEDGKFDFVDRQNIEKLDKEFRDDEKNESRRVESFKKENEREWDYLEKERKSILDIIPSFNDIYEKNRSSY